MGLNCNCDLPTVRNGGTPLNRYRKSLNQAEESPAQGILNQAEGPSVQGIPASGRGTFCVQPRYDSPDCNTRKE